MKYFTTILILFPIISAQNNTNTTMGEVRIFGLLSRSPLDWIQQALNTASNAFSLGMETGRQWFNFGINTANHWFNAINNPSNSTNNTSALERSIQKEIDNLQNDLANKGTWFRKVKESRLQHLYNRLNQIHENDHDRPTTPKDVSKYTFTTKRPNQSSRTTDGSIISVIT